MSHAMLMKMMYEKDQKIQNNIFEDFTCYVLTCLFTIYFVVLMFYTCVFICFYIITILKKKKIE